MLPVELKPQQFNAYPAEARKLVTAHLAALQRLPLSFLPNLLREAIDYDFKFPAERKSLESELETLDSLRAEQVSDWFSGFEQIRLSAKLDQYDWVNSPAQFVEQLSAHLWTTHQLDAFRRAATDYAARLGAAVPPEAPVVPRLGIAVIGQGVAAHKDPLFRKLRPHGAYFSRLNPENGLQALLDAVAARATAHPAPYAHWYIDGGAAAACDPALTSVSYAALEPVRTNLLRRVEAETSRPGMGPEALRTYLAQLRPADVGMSGDMSKNGSAVLDRFQLKLLTEGSGTQIFSTTFAQWAAREALRRAQPLTMLVRFAPRQRQAPMDELLSANSPRSQLDPVGSLIDADMAAYYNWLNQQRLTGADQTSFLVWFEDHNEAVAIGPAMPRGTESSTAVHLHELLSWMS
jgi:hypothetical protein